MKHRFIRIFAMPRRLWKRLLPESKPGARIAAPPWSLAIARRDQSHSLTVGEVYQWAIAGYVPRRYAGMITIFRSHDTTLPEQPDLGWRAVARDVDVHVIPGEHFTSITRHVRSLGEHFERALRSSDLAT